MRRKTIKPLLQENFLGAGLIFLVIFLLELLWAEVPVGWALLVSLLSVGLFLIYNRPFRRMAAKSVVEGEKLRRSLFVRLVPVSMIVAAVGYLWANGIGLTEIFDRTNAQRIVGIVAFLLVTAWPVLVPVHCAKK